MTDEDKVNVRNDKITKACQEIGYCCPYAFLMMNSSKRDTNKRLANKVNLSEAALKFNRRRLREGTLKCQERDNCQVPPEKD